MARPCQAGGEAEMTLLVTIGLRILDRDYIAECEVSITHKSTPGRFYGPPEDCYPAEGPEWELVGVTIYEDPPGKEPIALECPKWLADAIYSSDKLAEEVCERECD